MYQVSWYPWYLWYQRVTLGSCWIMVKARRIQSVSQCSGRLVCHFCTRNSSSTSFALQNVARHIAKLTKTSTGAMSSLRPQDWMNNIWGVQKNVKLCETMWNSFWQFSAQKASNSSKARAFRRRSDDPRGWRQGLSGSDFLFLEA